MLRSSSDSGALADYAHGVLLCAEPRSRRPSSSAGPTLPVPAASPNTDGEKSCAVQVQMLADVKTWQQNL